MVTVQSTAVVSRGKRRRIRWMGYSFLLIVAVLVVGALMGGPQSESLRPATLWLIGEEMANAAVQGVVAETPFQQSKNQNHFDDRNREADPSSESEEREEGIAEENQDNGQMSNANAEKETDAGKDDNSNKISGNNVAGGKAEKGHGVEDVKRQNSKSENRKDGDEQEAKVEKGREQGTQKDDSPSEDRLVKCGGHTAPNCEACPRGNGESWCNGECEWNSERGTCQASDLVHPALGKLLKHRPFQEVRAEDGRLVNILLVKTPLDDESMKLFQKYKKNILFLGISSFEAFPKSSPNPFSANFSDNLYRALFPGFLTMMPHPEQYFANSTRTVLLSQSDFSLDSPLDFGRRNAKKPKRYDFTFSGTDQDVEDDCVGWSSFAKNWTFLRNHALEIMCSPEFNLTGVLVATKNKAGTKACSIPKACRKNLVQTTFLDQTQFFDYTVQSHFVILPQIYDASPRVSSQALALNVPLLMNRNILGGWKYLNDKTGELFNDQSDFRAALRRIVDKSRRKEYEPRAWIEQNFGTQRAGRKFRKFVDTYFSDRVKFPEGTELLIPWGA